MKEVLPCLAMVNGDVCDHVAELAHGVDCAFEADSCEGHKVGQRGFLHNGAREIVGDHVHFQFLFDHGWRSATQHVHLECGLDIVKEQLHVPSVPIDQQN